VHDFIGLLNAKSCLVCPVKEQGSKAKYSKPIQRSEYQQNKEYYRKHRAIVEHP